SGGRIYSRNLHAHRESSSRLELRLDANSDPCCGCGGARTGHPPPSWCWPRGARRGPEAVAHGPRRRLGFTGTCLVSLLSEVLDNIDRQSVLRRLPMSCSCIGRCPV